MHNNCDQGEDCTRLHVCNYFIQGECNNRFCKKSHNLLESKSLLKCDWLSQETIQNLHMLCTLTHKERQQAPRGEARNGEPRGARGKSRGRGRGRPRDRRRAESQEPLKDSSRRRRNKGPHVRRQSDNRQPSKYNGGQRSGDESYHSDSGSDYNDTNSGRRLDSLMEDWFSPNTAPFGNTQVRSSTTSAGVTPKEGTRSGPSTKNQVVSPNANEPDLLPTLALPMEFLNSRIAYANTASVAPILSQNTYHPNTIISVKPSSVSESSSMKSLSTPNQTPVKDLGNKVCSPVTEPASVKPILSSTSKASLGSTSMSPSIAQPPPASSAAEGHLEPYPSLPGVSNFSTVSSGSDATSRKNQTDVKPIMKPDAASGIQHHQSDLIDLQPKPAGSKASEPQPTTKIPSVTPQKRSHVHQQLDNHRLYQYSGGQRSEEENYHSDSESYYDRNSTRRLGSLMEDWFSPNTEPLGNTQVRSPTTSLEFTPKEGARAVQSAKSLTVASTENRHEVLSNLAQPTKVLNSTTDHAFNIPKMGQLNTAIVPPILSHSTYHPKTHAPYPTTAQTRPAVHLPVMDSNTPTIAPTKESSLYQTTLLPPPSQPTFTTLKSGPSNTSVRPLITSSASFDSTTGDPSTQLKPLAGSVRLPSPTKSLSTPNQMPVKELGRTVCSPVAERAYVKPILSSSSSNASLWSTSVSPSITQTKPASSAAVGHLEPSSSSPGVSSFSRVSIGADTPSSRKPERAVKPILKPDAASGFQHQSDLFGLQPKCTNLKASEHQPTTTIPFVTPQKYVSGTWAKYGEPNTKKVSSSIVSSEPKAIYLSNPTGTIPSTAGTQQYNLYYQKISNYYRMQRTLSQGPEFQDFDREKMLRGSVKFIAHNSKPEDNSFTVVNYPPTWDKKAMPLVGYQNVLLSEACDEFSKVAKLFSKTAQGHSVQKVWRVQNPTLWQAYQRQKDLMKKKNSDINAVERQLFHGTGSAKTDAICRNNFDWLVCTNGTSYGQGNYFAKDASYAHTFSPPTSEGRRTMFVARVLVGDYATGNPAMRRPPQKRYIAESYDSCVDNVISPSVYVVFEKCQAYPEYLLEYKKEKSGCVLS